MPHADGVLVKSQISSLLPTKKESSEILTKIDIKVSEDSVQGKDKVPLSF